MNTRAIIAAYAAVARPITMLYMKHRGTCVASTAITIATLARFDISAIARPFRVIISNRARVQMLREWVTSNPAGLMPPIDLQLQWQRTMNAHELACGYGADPNAPPDAAGFDGHLVAIVSPEMLCVDASFDQFERKQKNLGPYPGVMVWPMIEHTQGAGAYVLPLPDGAIIRYQAHPDRLPAEWENSPDWTRDDVNAEIVYRIEVAMRDHLAKAGP